MLASRVARASAKGRSQQSGALKLSSVYTNLARKFFGPVPPKAALLDPVATCSIGEKCAVMIWGHALPICSENLEGYSGMAPTPFELGNQGLTQLKKATADFPSRWRRLCYNFYKLIPIAPSKAAVSSHFHENSHRPPCGNLSFYRPQRLWHWCLSPECDA